MSMACPKCGSDIKVDARKIQGNSAEIRCESCTHVFVARVQRTKSSRVSSPLPAGEPRQRKSSPKSATGSDDTQTQIPSDQVVVGVKRARRFPERIGPYDVLDEISRGGMGIVYKARDGILQRNVAIKVLLAGEGASDEDVKRFQREAQAAARLQHSNIVQIHSVGAYEGKPYLVMDFIEGQTVKQLLEGGRISPRLAVGITEGAAEALHHAARQGVIHRDVKPANIIVTRSGHALLMDFGLAKRVDEDLHITQSGTTMGTPCYMSPEQAEGKLDQVDGQSDVYSLGAVLYEMLTGQPPFDGQSTMAVLNKVLNEDPLPPRKLNPRIHGDIETICLKCLEKEKVRRYRNGRELAEDIRRFHAGEPISAAPVGRVGQLIRKARKNMRVTVTVLVALGFGLAALGYSLVDSALERRRQEDERLRDLREALRKGYRLLDKAKDQMLALPRETARQFEPQAEEIRKGLKESEDHFRSALYLDPKSREAQEKLQDVEVYARKLEVERFVFKAREFLEPPPNYPAALAFAEEALARDNSHKEAAKLRKQAIGIRAINIKSAGGNAEVFAYLLADAERKQIRPRQAPLPKGDSLGLTPIVHHEMSPGLYILTFVGEKGVLHEATFLVSRESETELVVDLGGSDPNMVLIPGGPVFQPLEGPAEVPAFLIDRYEYPNQAGQEPLTGKQSLLEAKRLCEEAGKQLCSTRQWLRACMGDAAKEEGTYYWPYGDTYLHGACATGLDPTARRTPFPAGWFPGCRTSQGVYDMSGNAAEWTDGDESQEIVFGGDWTDSVRTPHLTLSCRAGQIPSVVNKERVGVRCCKGLASEKK